jgi:glycosyltransferase involved in cell wall biosynthesis
MGDTPSTLPLVTVYIATCNRAGLLSRALASVWQQGVNMEILVVDDASDDETPELLQRWAAQGRLRWFRNERRLGACATRNRALREASGRYVTGLDDDDEMLPGRIMALLDALQPQDAFVCGCDRIQSARGMARIRLVPRLIDRDAILSRNVVGNQILAERTKVLACGGFDESLPAAQDYDLWIRLVLAHGAARGVRRILQRIHAHSHDSRISLLPSRRRGYWMVYRKHRSQMEPHHRRANLYNLRRANGRSTRLPRDLRFFVAGNRLRLLWHALRDLSCGAAAR